MNLGDNHNHMQFYLKLESTMQSLLAEEDFLDGTGRPK